MTSPEREAEAAGRDGKQLDGEMAGTSEETTTTMEVNAVIRKHSEQEDPRIAAMVAGSVDAVGETAGQPRSPSIGYGGDNIQSKGGDEDNVWQKGVGDAEESRGDRDGTGGGDRGQGQQSGERQVRQHSGEQGHQHNSGVRVRGSAAGDRPRNPALGGVGRRRAKGGGQPGLALPAKVACTDGASSGGSTNTHEHEDGESPPPVGSSDDDSCRQARDRMLSEVRHHTCGAFCFAASMDVRCHSLSAR